MKRRTIKISNVNWSLEDLNKFIGSINRNTPEQQAEAMTKCSPEVEERGREFEDAAR